MSVAYTATAALAATGHTCPAACRFSARRPAWRSPRRPRPHSTRPSACCSRCAQTTHLLCTTNDNNLSVWCGAGRSSRLARPVDTGASRRGAPDATGSATAEPAGPAPALLPLALLQGDSDDGDDGAAPGEQGAALAEHTRDGAVAGRSPQAFGSECEQPLRAQAARAGWRKLFPVDSGGLTRARCAAARWQAPPRAPTSHRAWRRRAATSARRRRRSGRSPRGGRSCCSAPLCPAADPQARCALAARDEIPEERTISAGVYIMLVIAGAGQEHRPRPPLAPPLAHTLSIRTHTHTIAMPEPLARPRPRSC